MDRDRLRLALRTLGGYHPDLDDVRIIDPIGTWDRMPDPTVLLDLVVEAVVESLA